MPLSKARMRERKRQDRLVKPKSNLNASKYVKPKLDELRQLIKDIEIKPVQPNYRTDEDLRWEAEHQFSPLIPEIDADGQPVPEYT